MANDIYNEIYGLVHFEKRNLNNTKDFYVVILHYKIKFIITSHKKVIMFQRFVNTS